MLSVLWVVLKANNVDVDESVLNSLLNVSGISITVSTGHYVFSCVKDKCREIDFPVTVGNIFGHPRVIELCLSSDPTVVVKVVEKHFSSLVEKYVDVFQKEILNVTAVVDEVRKKIDGVFVGDFLLKCLDNFVALSEEVFVFNDVLAKHLKELELGGRVVEGENRCVSDIEVDIGRTRENLFNALIKMEDCVTSFKRA